MSTTPATATTQRARRRAGPVRPRHRRHDLRIVRGAHRAAPQQARRRHGDGELRHRAGQRARAGGRGRRRPHRPGRGGRLHGARRPAGRSATTPTATPDEGADEARRLRDRLITSAVLSVPVVLLAMIPALQFEYWQWLSLTLAAPVVTWGAWPFHRAAWIEPAPRHGHDGHAHLARRAGRLRVVAVRAVPRRRRRARHDPRLHVPTPSAARGRACCTSRSPPA